MKTFKKDWIHLVHLKKIKKGIMVWFSEKKGITWSIWKASMDSKSNKKDSASTSEEIFFIGKNSAAILQVDLGHGEPVWWVQGHCGGHNVSLKNQLNKWTSRSWLKEGDGQQDDLNTLQPHSCAILHYHFCTINTVSAPGSYSSAFTSNVPLHRSLSHSFFLYKLPPPPPPFHFPSYCFYLALLLFLSGHSFAPNSVFQSFCLSSVPTHLFPFSLSSFLSPLPSTLSLLARSCLSRGRKSLEPALGLQGGHGEAAAGRQDLLLRETGRGERLIEPQLLLLTASLCPSMGLAA